MSKRGAALSRWGGKGVLMTVFLLTNCLEKFWDWLKNLHDTCCVEGFCLRNAAEWHSAQSNE